MWNREYISREEAEKVWPSKINLNRDFDKQKAFDRCNMCLKKLYSGESNVRDSHISSNRHNFCSECVKVYDKDEKRIRFFQKENPTQNHLELSGEQKQQNAGNI